MKLHKNILLLLIATLTLTSCGAQITEDNNTLETKIPQTMNIDQIAGFQDGDIVAVMKTTNGTFKIKLFVDAVPKTALNFIGLAQQGYYKDIIFHRIINNFMIQGGDPEGTGRGGESYYGTPFKDEFHSDLTNIKGSLSMANSGPNTNGSQFFINQAANNFLDNKHSVFGQVIEGTENIDRIAKTKTDASDKPLKDVKIISVEINEFKGAKLQPITIDVEAKLKELEAGQAEANTKKAEENKSRAVKSGDEIAVHYTGTFEDGEKFDSSLDRGQPLEFTVGAGQMIPGFDAGVIGMKLGEKKTLTLEAKDAYGEYDDTKVQEMPREQLQSFEDNGIKIEAGAELPTQFGIFKIKEVKDDIVVINTNHALAGKTLIFDVEIIEFKN